MFFPSLELIHGTKLNENKWKLDSKKLKANLTYKRRQLRSYI